ncbi:hypothetical protein [Neorhizobium alkalisoli]|uniref:ElaB/YqjD/DUF883 family membrane-anchored ribosome-binding protein n=1 Tax=Neorhizobium alkalisoli TaxID=528178 RepID=A0A561PVU7_9HYPH|nr:hypothetical protein [Neorhizobium alkalisoli]TWF42225.1 hypothetical protein FHW37_1233 [Neorhizobium alkalisoli]
MPDDDKSVLTASANDVDESLSTDAVSSLIRTVDQQRELEELRAEVIYLRSAARATQTNRSHSTTGAARSIRDEIEYQIRRRPFKMVAVAAVVGFVYGIAR